MQQNDPKHRPLSAPILGRDFRFVGTQSIDLADHFAVARRWRENVEAYRLWRRCCSAPRAL